MCAAVRPSSNTDDTLRIQEENLGSLTLGYRDLRRDVDNRFSEGKYRLYPVRVGVCIAVFVSILFISLNLLPTLSYDSSSNTGAKTGLYSVIASATATLITAIIFVIDDNLKTQRLNEKLAAKSYEIKIKRSEILSILQKRAIEEFNLRKTKG